MKRRNFLKVACSTGVGLGLGEAVQAASVATSPAPSGERVKCYPYRPEQPHIIFIMADQFRGDCLGCMGHPAVQTPNLDRLAQSGTLFTNGYSSAPSSTPARAGLLTGLSPWHHGMLGYGAVAEKYRYEMPRMLREQGYYTFGIGKMHWAPQHALHGFHATLVDESGRVESPDFISDYRRWFQLNAPGEDPDKTGIGWNDHAAKAYQLDERLHPTAWTGETARTLIRHYDREEPLFLKVSFARPHSPYDPPQRYLDRYQGVDIPAPVVGEWCGKHAQLQDPATADPSAPFGNFGADYASRSRRYYYANISFIDDQVGEIIDLLKKRGMYDQSLICFTADHGDMMGDHYHWRKTYPYEGSVKVPFVVKWPRSVQERIGAGQRVDLPVELRDFLPTFLELSGREVPADMDGKSLLGTVSNTGDAWRKYIDLEHATCYSADNYWCALTDGKVKYVWQLHTGREQLFDLIADPDEIHDCSSDSAYGQTLLVMRQAMVDHLSERGEDFVKGGCLVRREKTLLYSPNYPRSASSKRGKSNG